MKAWIDWRKHLLTCWRLVVFITLVAFVFPIKINLIRYCTVGGFVCVWAGALFLWWRILPVFLTGVVVAILTAFVLFLPGRPINHSMLRSADIRSLTEYRGTYYLWGGETTVGIDCSGLIRRGAIDGELSIGYRTLNARALREAYWMYWHDCSADDLGRGYGGRTQFVENVKSLNAANEGALEPGDMAVVAGGEHILGYLGNDTWIDADPKPIRVEEVHVPAPKNGWFVQPARIMRWQSMKTTR
jgi:hypothetical protein